PVDEHHARITGAPGGPNHAVEDLLRQESARDRYAVRIDQLVLTARGERVHEAVGRRHRDVEVGDAAIELAVDELEDVRVVDPEDPHVRASTRSTLLHRLGGAVEDAQKGHRARRAAAGRGDDVILWAQPREREAGSTARLVDDRRGLHRVEDLFHRVADRQDIARGVLKAVSLAGVHEGWRVRQEVPLDHDVVERLGDLPDR